ncbi:Trk system potassium transporter TrkA [Clostridium sp.]|uniref:Trk system potassium transporter TrkA n=1 Tax=Clostridium sp. TaxID=1506 RepID=UPI002603DB4E|nr:Trk system potassium transporter TrkA [Clostridium sp.]
MKVMIVGAGKLGCKLAGAMLNENIDVTLMDSNSKVIERINDHLDVLTVNANGLEVEILRELNIETYDLLLASTSSDETNTIICTLAKKLGCIKTIARIRSPEYTKQLDFIKNEMGIDHIVNPDLATASEITRYLLKRYNFYSGNFAKGRVQMIDLNINSINNSKEFIGQKVMELDNIQGLLIVAISRNGNIIIPDGSTELVKDDIIYLMGESKIINNWENKYRPNFNKRHIKRIMIFGGGKIGYYLSKQLNESNINVVIVEQDRERCKYLTTNLSNALIIHGDGTDMNLLQEEDLPLMDAFVGATGYDEQNILMCLMAKQYNVNKVITKISRPSYSHVIDKLGIDLALNPVNITVSEILKFIRGGKVVSVSLLLGEEAEVTEVIVGDNLPVVGKKIAELGLPRGIIIGSVVHKGKVIIPNGNTVINSRDRLIIFCLTQNIPAIDMFLKEGKGGILNELWHGNQGIRKYIKP